MNEAYIMATPNHGCTCVERGQRRQLATVRVPMNEHPVKRSLKKMNSDSHRRFWETFEISSCLSTWGGRIWSEGSIPDKTGGRPAQPWSLTPSSHSAGKFCPHATIGTLVTIDLYSLAWSSRVQWHGFWVWGSSWTRATHRDLIIVLLLRAECWAVYWPEVVSLGTVVGTAYPGYDIQYHEMPRITWCENGRVSKGHWHFSILSSFKSHWSWEEWKEMRSV